MNNPEYTAVETANVDSPVQPQPTQTHTTLNVHHEQDGVFSNMAAKPEGSTPGKLYNDIEPPSYNDVTETIPTYGKPYCILMLIYS